MRTIGTAVLAVGVLACTPPAHMTRYMDQHQAEWVAPSALPEAIRPGTPERRLLEGMGRPLSSSTSLVGEQTIRHYTFCTHLRMFDTDNGPQSFAQWDDGQWHPVIQDRCESNLYNWHTIRVVVANGVVSQVSD